MSQVGTAKKRCTYFVADLHLSDERPAATGRFFRFLKEEASGAEAVYILGDLFEVWVGDDHDEQVAFDTASQIKALVDSGTPVFFMHGNRDFLLAKQYAASSGMLLLDDPAQIDLYGAPTLLMHGDTLCTDDTRYQRVRRVLRHGLVQALLRSLPLRLRQRMARQARARSEAAKALKPAAIMDVNSEEVTRTFQRAAVERLIHGHTHRPAQHTHQIKGRSCERWVLPDWYTRWGYVECDSSGCRLSVDAL